jgi:hypothetical protein
MYDTYSNSVEVHPQLSNNKSPVDGALEGVGLLRPPYPLLAPLLLFFISKMVLLRVFKSSSSLNMKIGTLKNEII